MNILRGLKDSVLRSLSAFGLHLYPHKSLPWGMDLKLDIARCKGREIECIFDVGANVGQSVLRFHTYWPNAKIFCFEPIKSTFCLLADNTRNISNVHSENKALGVSRGIGTIWSKEDSSTNSLKAEVNRPETSLGQPENVEIITLDEFCLEHQVACIDFLKIDVEGYELEVLKGANRMITSGAIQFIYAETTFHLSDSQHTPITILSDFLEARSYRCLNIYNKVLRFDPLGRPTHLHRCDALFKLQDQHAGQI